MADFKQGDVVCLNSDLEHKFTVHQIISAGPRKGWIEVVYWDGHCPQFCVNRKLQDSGFILESCFQI